MKEQELVHSLERVVEVLMQNKNGCKQEATNIALEALGVHVEHNPVREFLNSTQDDYRAGA
jgi:hypothetical protein